MIARRVVEWACVLVATTMIVATVGAVPLSVFVDRGPTGSGRFTAFPLALAISDVSVREAARNSLVLASCVSLMALVLGAGLARVVAGREFRGRSALAAMARASGSVPPLFGAIGIVGLGWPGEGPWRWVALAWIELAWAVPRVMGAAEAGLERVSPSWEDAARLAGASRWRAWWAAAWPLARPGVARAVAGVFAIVLVEPGAPLVLGMRRTLGFGIVDAVLGGDRAARAAALGAVALVLAVVGRILILKRGGPLRPLPPESRPWRRPRVSWAGATASRLVLMLWAAVSLLPTAALLATTLGLDGSGRGTLAGLGAVLGDREAPAILADGAILGLAATATAAALAWGLDREGRGGPSWRRPWAWPGAVPPLIFGLGAALLPGLIDAAAGAVASRALGFARGLHHLADAMDPFLSPWPLLVAIVALLRLPEMAAAFAAARAADHRAGVDVARTLGASRWAAWRTIRAPGLVAIWAAALCRSFARSALDAGPALLLSATLAARPIAPGVLMLAAEPNGLRRAAAVASMAMLMPIVAWVAGAGPGRGVAPFASRGRAG